MNTVVSEYWSTPHASCVLPRKCRNALETEHRAVHPSIEPDSSIEQSSRVVHPSIEADSSIEHRASSSPSISDIEQSIEQILIELPSSDPRLDLNERKNEENE
jgi:hypothetical protein